MRDRSPYAMATNPGTEPIRDLQEATDWWVMTRTDPGQSCTSDVRRLRRRLVVTDG